VISDENRRPLIDVVFLRRASPALRVVIVAVSAVAVGAGGTEIARLQEHFAAQLAAGAPVSSIGTLLGRGSVPATAAAGWVAAVLFAIALFRLHRGPLEPSPGIRPVEAQTVDQLRLGLRREYTAIRVALVVVLLIAALDVARAIAVSVLIRRGGMFLSGSFALTVLEAAGLAAAAIVLSWWAASFGRRLEQLGAL
jgi:hypothetical protein